MSGMAKRIVLTAWNENWLDSPEIILKMKPALGRLQAAGAAVILFSACDRAQLEPVRKTLELTAPFIVESGSAVFTPVEHSPFEEPLGDRDGDYFVRQLGCPYVQARAGLRVIANVIAHPLKGFGDFTIPQLQRLSDLSEEAAHRAKDREFSELFMTPKAVDPQILQRAAEEMGFNVIWRTAEESRFSELIGSGASLTVAVEAVLSAYSASGEALEVVGLSHLQSALDNLRAVADDAKGETNFEEALLTSVSIDSWLTAVETTNFF